MVEIEDKSVQPYDLQPCSKSVTSSLSDPDELKPPHPLVSLDLTSKAPFKFSVNLSSFRTLLAIHSPLTQ